MLEEVKNRLIKSLKLLSSSGDEQKAYLRRLGTYPIIDEIALEFDDAFKQVLGHLSELKLPEHMLSEILTLNEILDKLSLEDCENLWQADSLEEKEWNEVRELARQILKNIKSDL